MAVPTWSQLTFLSAPQQAKAAEFATIGDAYALWKAGRGPKPDLSGVNQSQCKQATKLLDDLGTLIGPARVGIEYSTKTFEAQVIADWEAANP